MTAKFRVEYVRLRRGGDDGAMSSDIIALNGGGAQIIAVGATSVLSAAAPAFTDKSYDSGVWARIIALSASGYAEVGSSPVADAAGGTLVEPGKPVLLPIKAGEMVALILAAPGANASGNLTAASPAAGGIGALGTPIAGKSFNLVIGTPGVSLGGSVVEIHRALDGTNFSPITYPDGSKVSYSTGVNLARSEDQADVPYRLVAATYVASVAWAVFQ